MNMQLTLDSCENGGPPPLPFSGGEEEKKPPPIPKWEGRREASSCPTVISNLLKNLLKKNEVQRRKNYRKWCQNDQEGLKHGEKWFL